MTMTLRTGSCNLSTWFSLMTPRWRCRPRYGWPTPPRSRTRSTTVADLDAFFDEFGYTGRHDRDPGRARRRPRAPAAAPRAAHRRPRRRRRPRQRDAGRAPTRSPSWSATTPSDWHLHAVDHDAPLADADRGRDRDGDDRRDPRRRDVPARDLRRRRLRGRRARPVPQPVTPLLLDHLRQPQRGRRLPGPPAPPDGPTSWPAKRRSTSRKTSGCSECTQCPASLTVTRRFRGNHRSIAATYSSRTYGDVAPATHSTGPSYGAVAGQPLLGPAAELGRGRGRARRGWAASASRPPSRRRFWSRKPRTVGLGTASASAASASPRRSSAARSMPCIASM